jgi:hypothetical protein
MPVKKKKGASINRVGDAVMPNRRDPDIGKMIKEVKTPNVKHSGKTGLNQGKFSSSKGKRYASGGMAKKGKGC